MNQFDLGNVACSAQVKSTCPLIS